MVLIVSMVIGTIIGEMIDLDDKLNKLGNFLKRKFGGKKSDVTAQKVSIAEGFVTSSLLFCVGLCKGNKSGYDR